MAEYQKSERINGDWVKGKDVRSGSKAKFTSEVHPTASQFKDKEGNPQMQDVGKILIQGDTEAKNISVNRSSLNALIDAYGNDSANWIGKILTIETLKMMVAGKMQTAVYLIPEGYELKEDDAGYMEIVKKGASSDINADDVDPAEIPF